MNAEYFAAAPGDLLLEIAAHLDCRADIFNLCLTSQKCFTTISSILYASVTLHSAEQCSTTLRMLKRRPDIARHVRELVVKPSHLSSPDKQFHDSEIASAAVRDVAMSRVLDALVKFTWDFDDLPFYDDMWFALRVCCEQLRFVGTSMGDRIPSLHSHLFDFVDLRGFSLYLKRTFFESHLDIFSDEEQPISRRFWNMLMTRCPNLQELVIEGVSPFPVDARPLSSARWPSLRRLVLGDIAVDWLPGDALTVPEAKSPFIEFLEAHPSLQTLGLSRSNVNHIRLATMTPDAVKLRSFQGTLEQLQSIPYMHKYLECVAFRESMRTREVTALAVAGLLQKLTSLRKLKISFMLHSMYDSGNLLRSLIASCPNLTHLELACGHKPSFQLDSFAKLIRGFPKLRALRLTIVKYPGDENLAAGATRIAMTNPRIQDFSLTFLPPPYPFGFPFPFFAFLPLPFRSSDSGSFTLICDKHGLPQTLRGFERNRLQWPFGLGQSYRIRRYASDLRPAGSPSRRRTGLKGLSELLMENSSAGEEMRMILFCALLVFLAIWGFWTGSRHSNQGARYLLSTSR
ncbi:hypothetical protein D9757_006114 [Collybiopsis confluens]|uniref:F-box domain-containing protein n=1 Tax=Collybiopsis confluens TaxID=2823264 RepID=A0A8H5HHH3_9AGAR|nr:hypothetical protein D9757_006114 [Collybiopsis confluens]